MKGAELNITKVQTDKLLGAASADAALLYLYLQSGNEPEKAETDLHMSGSRFKCAVATLRQLGLWEEKKPIAMVGERPNYSERDVIGAVDTDNDFRSLYEEVQRLLGKQLNTEELKILLSFVRYLGMSSEVVSMLVCYCKERARLKGGRNPSLRAIEKEAYLWAEKGIDTMEEAIAYTQTQFVRRSRLGRLMEKLQIRGRNLTAAEERYAQQWLDWGFDEEAIGMAYERTCLNTGGLSWAYMNKILTRWQEAGLLTGDRILAGDKKPVPTGASGQLGAAELEAIKRVLQEG